jgi:alpha-galactosidase
MLRGFFLFTMVAVGALSGAGFGSRWVQVEVNGSPEALFTYTLKGWKRSYAFTPPVLEVDGQSITAHLSEVRLEGKPQDLPNGTREYRYSGPLQSHPDLTLEMTFRLPQDNPVLRFRYTLQSARDRKLTKSDGKDRLTYFTYSLAKMPDVKEVRLSEWNDLVHSFVPSERVLDAKAFGHGLKAMGPILTAADGSHRLLVAYEHGSQAPDAFLEYGLNSQRLVSLSAVKGSYYNGQVLDKDRPYVMPWLQVAALYGNEDELAAAYRTYVLRHFSLSPESRKPYIFYNTWNFQERNKWFRNQPYLASMNNKRLLAEIDAAYKMGVEVFVVDTGWYEKTGDWPVSRVRFPDGLKAIRERLDSYGMKLGLWFGPRSAAVSSNMLKTHRDCVMSFRGEERKPSPVWETEVSYSMCLVSRYREAFAERLIQLHRELGVTYFKWDAVDQYGCDDPRHWHGNESNTPEERADSYAFQLPQVMAEVVEKITASVPNAIVDFDITEGNRSTGLSFLSSGKYFLINNGPYYHNYDVPIDLKTQNWNLFFYKGPARTWICRTPLSYDRWIPSVLFLTHFFPDDPAASQMVNTASLMLGGNGIWGDLLEVSEKGVTGIRQLLDYYKQVREDITEASPVRSGAVAGTPEIHEKISSRGRGVVVVFSNVPGRFTYITQAKPATAFRSTSGVEAKFDGEGHARLEVEFREPGAQIAFFGVR